MKNILNNYEKSSSQEINLGKSNLYYSRNMPQDIKENISATLNATECIRMGRHLGVSFIIGRKEESSIWLLQR